MGKGKRGSCTSKNQTFVGGDDAKDMLNFRFSKAPPSRESVSSTPRRSSSNRNTSAQYRRTKQDKASARKKAQNSMFVLHSSADHAFVLSRKGGRNAGNSAASDYTFAGVDAPVSWDAVRVVKYLIDGTDQDQSLCPICLDSFECARITKCGHTFCLPCILRHVHTSSETNPYQEVKCPCCALPVHVQDLRPVTLESVQPPKVGRKLKLTKLHRCKTCPAPYIPSPSALRHSSPHTAPESTDSDAAFSRFNYIDTYVYQCHLAGDLAELQKREGELLRTNPTDTELLFVQLALERVRGELNRAQLAEADEVALAQRYHQPQCGMYEQISPLLAALKLRAEHITIEAVIPSESDEDQTKPRSSSFHSLEEDKEDGSSDRRGRPNRGYSMDSVESAGSGAGGRLRRQKKLVDLKASLYLDEDSTQFYQAADGQLCFLSKFNMSCLLSEFSSHVPEGVEEPVSPSLLRSLQPLPDSVEGRILEVESVYLTPDMRKRLPFLSHLPPYIDVRFVELDINNILSDKTRKQFKAEFFKRRQRRKKKEMAEKRVDEAAKKKEEERINELRSRIQRIDPNDDFFKTPTLEEDFPATTLNEGAALITATNVSESSPQNLDRVPELSFRSIVTTPSNMAMTEEAFPSLSSFPSLGSSPPPSSASTSSTRLADGWHASKFNDKSLESDQQVSTSPPRKGKKSKSKNKIVLFSTGGNRGSVY